MIASFPLNRNKMFVKSKDIPIDPTADILAGHKEMAREISRKR